jgi:hypothetical protein
MEERLKKSFPVFLGVLWKHLSLPQPTKVQVDIAEFLQAGPTRRVIEAFRGVGKSWITAAYVLWRLYRNPQLKILVVSASKDRSDAFSIFCKSLIEEVPILSFLKPRGNQRQSNLAFDVGPARPSQSPSVKSVGIFGQITGSRADVIVADDVETPKTAYTQTMRDRLWEAVKEFDAVLTTNEKEQSIIYLGTPQTEMSLYNELPNRGYMARIWPARFPTPELARYYGAKLAPKIMEWSNSVQPGDAIDPDRFDDHDLLQRELSYGKTGFSLQFMLDTRLTDENKYPLKLRDLMVFNVGLEKAPQLIHYGSGPEQTIPPQILPMVGLPGDRWFRPMMVDKDPTTWRPYQGSVLSIDPSGRGSDETAYAVAKMLHGNIWVPAAGGLPGGYDRATLERLAKIAQIQKVNWIRVESNFGDGMFTELFKPILRKIHPCTIEEVRNSKQKELRIIDTLEPVMNQHRLIVDEELIRKDAERAASDQRNYSLFYQMSRITRQRGALGHDDAIDVLADAVAYWVDKMGKEQQEAYDERRQEELERALKDFVNHAIGTGPGSPNGPTWFTTPHEG